MAKVQHPLKRIAFILVLIIILPALFYSFYEINSLSTTENLLNDIYRQQLDALLFSVNQYSWDVVNGWVENLNRFLRGASPDSSELRRFLQQNGSIENVFLADSNFRNLHIFTSGRNSSAEENIRSQLRQILRNQPELPVNLRRLKKSGYRKLEAVALENDSAGNQSEMALIFIPENTSDQNHLAGITLNVTIFIRQILSPKLQEIAGEQFILAIFDKNTREATITTEAVNLQQINQTRQVWLFPNHLLGIRMKGNTVEELARSRFYRNLVLIILLDVVIIAGAWVVFRSIRREMELAQMKSDFVSNISHELRTPLSLIRMFSETLEMDRIKDEKKKREYYQVISQESERLTHMVNNILNFSRIEAGRKEYHRENVNLNAIVQNVLDNYQFHLQKEGFHQETQLAEGLPEIEADPQALSEALINLIDNAVKYSDIRKFIAIRTGRQNETVFLEVEDHGIGIPPDQQNRIFEKFYRIPDGLVHRTKGSGLGLTLVRHIMDAHKSKIQITSEAGKGTCFRLLFPIKNLKQIH